MSFFRLHKRVIALHSDELVTRQEHKDECDINNILSIYKRTGIIAHVQKSPARWEELPGDVDYQASLNTIMQAQDAFASLPSTVRSRYDNDPARFLAALQDPKEEADLIAFGILKPRPTPEPPADPPATPKPS